MQMRGYLCNDEEAEVENRVSRVSLFLPLPPRVNLMEVLSIPSVEYN